jgi:uncharacterized protein (TIGR03000 family)
MTRARLIVLALLAGAILMALPAECAAQRFRRAPVFPPNRMPGWDWWRTYPWSPYNYGRNPYNPAVVPYPYPYVYPSYYYAPYPPYPVGPSALADGAIVPTASAPQVVVPHPVSGYTEPPADAAVLELRVPDTFAAVTFDGVRTSSLGDTRWYVTPELQPGKSYHYTVAVTWSDLEGKPATRERTVKVLAGHTSVVDFTQAAR